MFLKHHKMLQFSFYVNDVNKERKVKYYTCILIDPFNKLILIEYHFNIGVILVFIGINNDLVFDEFEK